MPWRAVIFVGLLLFFVVGCAKERVYENVYQGLQNREQLVHPANEPIPREHQSYHEYKKERQDALKKEREESR